MATPVIGFAAMLEQFGPREIVDQSVAAEAAGFSGVMAADHFQPWVPQQGEAAFVWNVMTAIGERTAGDVGPGVWDVAGWVSPNPKGVGPMTRAMLLSNIVEIAEKSVGR